MKIQKMPFRSRVDKSSHWFTEVNFVIDQGVFVKFFLFLSEVKTSRSQRSMGSTADGLNGR